MIVRDTILTIVFYYDLKQEILKTDISIAMAISSLIREPINIEEQKKTRGILYRL